MFKKKLRDSPINPPLYWQDEMAGFDHARTLFQTFLARDFVLLFHHSQSFTRIYCHVKNAFHYLYVIEKKNFCSR
jgi:hypothetical protein